MNADFVNTPDGLRTIVADIVRMARKGGADMAEAAATESFGMEATARRGKLENLDIGREQRLSVTAIVNGGSGTATIGDLRAAAMREAVERAIAIARASASDPHAGLAEAALMAVDPPDLDLHHPWEISPEAALELARRGEEAAFAAHGAISREKSDGASAHTGATLSALANSHGFCAAERSTAHSLSVSAIAERDGEMQQDGWSETRRNAADLPTAEEIGEKAGRRAARRLGGGKVAAGRGGALFLAPAAHTLLGHFVAAASGGALYRKMSWLLDCWEERVFPAHVGVREEPHLPREMRSAAHDDDGVATSPRDIVRDGAWEGRFLSAYSARRLGAKSTGNAGGAHNLELFSRTPTAAAELVKTLGRGIVVAELMGQGANRMTGDYSRGAAGFWAEGGEIVYPVSEVTIAGNLRDMLLSIAAVGDDAMRRGGMRCGSLLIPDMAIGGNQ